LVLTAPEFQSKALKMSLTQSELEELIRKAIALYNRIKSPEVTAKLIFVSPAIITISFSGGFCYGCGIFDIVEGFANQFKMFSGKAELKVGKTRQINPRTFEADYTPKVKSN
jgi:hypothetical protein